MTTSGECGPNQRCCRDCGKVILERTEICPGCGCRQTGVPPVGGRTNTNAPYIPLSTEMFTGALFSVVALFFLHFYFVANWTGMLFGGSPFYEWGKYLVMGTFIGSVLWTGSSLVVSAVGAREPKVLLTARGVIQGAVMVPIAAYLEPSYLHAEASLEIAALFALLGGGYAFWLSLPASQRLLRGLRAGVSAGVTVIGHSTPVRPVMSVLREFFLQVSGLIFLFFSASVVVTFHHEYQKYATHQEGLHRVVLAGVIGAMFLCFGLGSFGLARRMRSKPNTLQTRT